MPKKQFSWLVAISLIIGLSLQPKVAKRVEPYVIEAEEMDITPRKIVAYGAETLPKLTGPKINLTSRRIELILNEAGSDLERLEAYGQVQISIKYKREASSEGGQKLEAAERKVEGRADRATLYKEEKLELIGSANIKMYDDKGDLLLSLSGANIKANLRAEEIKITGKGSKAEYFPKEATTEKEAQGSK